MDKGENTMRKVKPTPRTMYLYNPYLELAIDIAKPMSRFKMWFWKLLLGFEYREEY